jgi:hypothetical protein
MSDGPAGWRPMAHPRRWRSVLDAYRMRGPVAGPVVRRRAYPAARSPHPRPHPAAVMAPAAIAAPSPVAADAEPRTRVPGVVADAEHSPRGRRPVAVHPRRDDPPPAVSRVVDVLIRIDLRIGRDVRVLLRVRDPEPAVLRRVHPLPGGRRDRLLRCGRSGIRLLRRLHLLRRRRGRLGRRGWRHALLWRGRARLCERRSGSGSGNGQQQQAEAAHDILRVGAIALLTPEERRKLLTWYSSPMPARGPTSPRSLPFRG